VIVAGLAQQDPEALSIIKTMAEEKMQVQAVSGSQLPSFKDAKSVNVLLELPSPLQCLILSYSWQMWAR
jgi:hypothetical protein